MAKFDPPELHSHIAQHNQAVSFELALKEIALILKKHKAKSELFSWLEHATSQNELFMSPGFMGKFMNVKEMRQIYGALKSKRRRKSPSSLMPQVANLARHTD